MMAVCYDEVDPLPTEWLWQDRIPLGDATLLFGAGAVGKGRMLIDLAARVTRGDPMPLCGEGAEPGSVVLILPEDDPNEQVAHRLRSAGADLSRVFDLTRLDGGGRFKLSADGKTAGHLGHLRALVDQLERDGKNPRLVIIDPLAAVLGWGTIATNAGARRLVEPLQDMAKDTGIAVLVVAHTVKSGLLQGSAGLPQALRLVYRISLDPDNPAMRVVSVDKGNNVPQLEDIRYTIAEREDGAVAVAWQDRAAMAEQRMSWRDELRARREARRDARKGGDAAGPLPAASPARVPLVTRYNAVMVKPGLERPVVLANGTADTAMAKLICEATGEAKGLALGGHPLAWEPDGKGGWRAGHDVTWFHIAPVRLPKAVV